MKLELTPQRILANQRNAKIATDAWVEKRNNIYNQNPSSCKQCGVILPRKKKNNKFCSSSCAATFNNTGKQKAPRYKCIVCANLIKSGKYCSTTCSGNARRKYNPEELTEIKRKRVREISANYRAKVKNQTPADVDRKAIQEFYNNCPIGYEVDHIIPISKGGLHTLSNLQYLTISENRKKSNKINGALGGN